ncbi:MAG: DUF4832 domain-containing protein [Bacteroidaceae bacterium]|nr:DUF4832 domain-containing protein [Bacteroidaceae bacterium]
MTKRKYLWLIIIIFACTHVGRAQSWHPAVLTRRITHPQPMTGLVLWPAEAKARHATYGNAIQLEFAYCLPCKVVTGCREDGTIEYDWSWFDRILDDVASRSHQLIARFRYEYPSSRDVDGQRGTTAVPDYIKQRTDYTETFAENPNNDGPTWYADWSNVELQRFTLQFYADFARRYAHDARLAFLEVGFGHWSEYHIYGTELALGRNFPSKDFQKQFFEHLDTVMTGIPWAVSVDAGDKRYSPVAGDSALMALTFGAFDDSFMHKTHELSSGGGFNERCWNAVGRGTRWQRGVCGGEISYYSRNDQRSFLSPDGLYGHTWAEQAAKYHITFMIANDAPRGDVATPERFRDGSLATGYRFVVRQCETDGRRTRLQVANEGVAPIYRDAWFAIGPIRSDTSLRELLPGGERWVEIAAAPNADGSNVQIVSDCILPQQAIEFEADIGVQ